MERTEHTVVTVVNLTSSTVFLTTFIMALAIVESIGFPLEAD